MIKKLGAAPTIAIADGTVPRFDIEREGRAITIKATTLAERFATPRGDTNYQRTVNLTGMPPAQPRSLGEMNVLDPALQDRYKAESLARDILKRIGKREIEEARDETAKFALAARSSQLLQDTRLRDFLARQSFMQIIFAAQSLRTVLRSKDFQRLMYTGNETGSRVRLLAEFTNALAQAIASAPPEEREMLFTSWQHNVNDKVVDLQAVQSDTLGGPAVDTLNMMLAGMDMARRYSGKG